MKFSAAHRNPGKRSAEKFTQISRQISRHFWQRKTEKFFTSALLQGSCSDVPSSRVSRECRSPGLRSPPPLKNSNDNSSDDSNNSKNSSNPPTHEGATVALGTRVSCLSGGASMSTLKEDTNGGLNALSLKVSET